MTQLTMTLIRHAYSMGNAAGVYSGVMDVALAPEGEQMVVGYREQGVYARWATAERYYSSPLRRCLRTLELAFDGAAEPYATPEALKELDFGELEGMRPNPGQGLKFFTEWVGGRAFPELLHIETFEHLEARGSAALADIARQCAEDGLSSVTVVLHSALGRAALVGLAGLEPQAFLQMSMPNALGYVVTFDVANPVAPRFVRADPYGPADVVGDTAPVLPAR